MLFGTGLRGEGNILHHLRPCGYRLTYVQSKLHEFDFAVHSLAADLGDGMRLCKLAEKLTGARGCTAADTGACRAAESRLVRSHHQDSPS